VVFVTLVTIGAPFTARGGVRWVRAAVDPRAPGAGAAIVSVRDTGVGMAPEFLARAFALFSQGTEAAARGRGGLGIGLALVRRLVEMHGGTVEAHSDGPGKGSEFIVRLPLAREEIAAPGGPAAGGRLIRRVLVVDDNADAATSLALLLRQRGHEVQLALDGPKALALAKDYCPDVVLLDLGLPGMDGFEVARLLRKRPALEKAMLVALTGSSVDEDMLRSRESGFDHFFIKPVDPEDLERLLAGD
jgi:two-component system CheB/CheR fusion protein